MHAGNTIKPGRMMKNATYWIERFNMVKHPEGGFFHETHRSIETIRGEHLPPRYNGDRRISTAIYFLLKGDRPSLFHRLKSEEIWHFYAGCPVTIHVINAEGEYSNVRLGVAEEGEEAYQGIIHAGSWFGAIVDDPEGYSLVGCTVAPGFDFTDFEMGERADLLGRYPRHRGIIERLTR
jgi:predicted cupin superfamily sugar epimerase